MRDVFIVHQKMPKAVVNAKTKKSSPPTMRIPRSERYWERYEPAMTAVPVARKWPAVAPAHTPSGSPAALSAMVASWLRSPISATVVSVKASITCSVSK